MQLVKLTEEQLKNISSGINLQRAENYVGKFINCSVDDSFNQRDNTRQPRRLYGYPEN